MSSGRFFRRVRKRARTSARRTSATLAGLRALLARFVIGPFKRMSEIGVVVVPLIRAGATESEDPPANPVHPACTQYAGSHYCQESWRLHLAQLRRQPEAHWHTCEFGMFCALVPLAHDGRCLAAVRLACPATMPEADFDRHVAFLDVLVENFAATHACLLKRLLCSVGKPVAACNPAAPCGASDVQPDPNHPRVLRAIQYITDELANPALSVGCVARAQDVQPNYLSGLFCTHLGQRLSRYILDRRIERAKTLLATTNWMIKQVGQSAGFAHPNWFSHLFAENVGMTPVAYRRSVQRRSPRR